jgi:uncharacterized membrane protein YqjE
MDSRNTCHESTKQTGVQDIPVNDSSLLDDARTLWHEVRGLSHDRLQLVALEAQRAGVSFINMIMTGVVVAVLLCSAWLGLLSAVVITLIENGVIFRSALLLAVALNLLLALIGYRYLYRKSRFLKFPATLQSLQPEAARYRDGVHS